MAALKPPTDIAVSDWANENIILLPESSWEPGPYRWQRTPYAKAILDLYKRPEVRHIVLKWGPQLGKTIILYIINGHIIEQDPFPTMLAYPTEDEGRRIVRTRVQPMIDSSPALRAKKPRDPRKYQIDEMHFPGKLLYVVGSNSPSPLSQKPCRNMLRDEANKNRYREQVDKTKQHKIERR